jgi:hypothetical protein
MRFGNGLLQMQFVDSVASHRRPGEGPHDAHNAGHVVAQRLGVAGR